MAAEPHDEPDAPSGSDATDEPDAYDETGHRKLGTYAATLATYGASVSALALAGWARRRRELPSIGALDLAIHGLATFKVSRALTKDAITSPLRAPFAHYEGRAETPAEVMEKPRGRGVRKVIGELITCPFCTAQWVGTAFGAGMLFAPRATRLMMTTLAGVTVSDFTQFAYVAAEKRT